MPTILPEKDAKGKDQYRLGLYDPHAEGYPSVLATSVVDVTDLTHGDVQQAIIKLGRDSLGTIVLFQDRYEVGEDIGTQVHFYLDEGFPKDIGDHYFPIRDWGFRQDELLKVVMDSLPRSPNGN